MKISQKNLFVLLLDALALFFVYLAWNGRFIDSEIWGISRSTLWQGPAVENFSFYYKFLFHVALALLSMLPWSNASFFLAARMLYAFLALINVALTIDLAKKIGASLAQRYFLAFAILSSTFFLAEAFHVRSDFLSLFWNLLFLRSFVQWQNTHASQRPYPLLRWSLWQLPIFFSTPKAVFWVLSNLALLIYARRDQLKNPRMWVRLFTFFVAYALVGLCFWILSPSLAHSYQSAFSFFSHTWQWAYGNSSLQRPSSMLFVWDFVVEHLPLIALMLLGFWSQRRRTFSSLQKAMLAYTFLSGVLCLALPEKLPFLLSSWLPFLALATALSLPPVPTLRTNSRLLILLVILASNLYWVADRWYFLDNRKQIESIRRLEDFVQQEHLGSYYDVIGLLPYQPRMSWYFSLGEDFSKHDVLAELERQEPDLIFLTMKMEMLMPELQSILDRKYHSLEENIWISNKAWALRPELQLHWLPFHSLRNQFQSLSR